ncbi:MAG: nucleotide exchange factor GrpE [Planctomycetota bacterium]
MFPRKKEKQKEEHQPDVAEQETAKKEQPIEEPQKQVEQMRKQIEDLRKEKDDIFAKLQRVAADYDNFQKRSAKQITDSVAYEKDKTIKTMLPVLDDFERALAHAENSDSVAEGVKLVYEHLKGVLRSQGVEQIETTGQRFDPSMHEAIVQQSDDSKEDGVVLEELQKGYKLNGRVIRASRVVVNKTPAAEDKLPADDETKDTQ